MRAADHCRLGDARVGHQCALDLHGPESVPGDVEHVVDAPHDPVIPVRIAVRRVAGDVAAVLEL